MSPIEDLIRFRADNGSGCLRRSRNVWVASMTQGCMRQRIKDTMSGIQGKQAGNYPNGLRLIAIDSAVSPARIHYTAVT